MLLIGLSGTELTTTEQRWLTTPGVAGVILFARNFKSRLQLLALTESIRTVGGDHLLLAVDQEGGPVQRFRDGFTRLPALSRIGEVYDRNPHQAIQLAEEHAWVMASELRASGIDFSFAPVVDLARGNAAIGPRAFHPDVDVTAELATCYVRGMHLGGMSAVLKHFPGHGSVAPDTHVAPAIDRRTLDVIRRTDLRPFIEALSAHAEAVMMAHVIYPVIDSDPAGCSSIWIKQILRDELGFTGLVISDDISMVGASVAGDLGSRVKACIRAGCDLVLACDPDVVEEAIAALPIVVSSDARSRLAKLRGSVGASWEALQDNPQRDYFISRITELDTKED